jgi:single-stranded-DNA-specific exonuclease
VAENEERKRLTQILTADLVAEAESPAARARASLVFAGQGWHPGVVGIVASRLVEQFGKPAAVIAINEGVGKGSLRSVPSVHLGHALDACRPHLLKGGGHAMAAGLTIDPERVSDFSAAFEQHVAGHLPPGGQTLVTGYDAEATVADLDQDFFVQLEAMAPFGVGNAEPVVRVQGAAFVSRPKPFGRDGDHLRGALTDGGGGMREFLAWRAGKRIDALSAGGVRFNLLVRPEAGRWRGELQPRLVFVDGATA